MPNLIFSFMTGPDLPHDCSGTERTDMAVPKEAQIQNNLFDFFLGINTDRTTK